MKKIIFIILMSGLLLRCKTDERILEVFLKEIERGTSFKELKQKDIVETNNITNLEEEAFYDQILYQLSNDFKTCGLDDISITPHSPENDFRNEFPETMNSAIAYSVSCKDKLITFILVRNNKILAFSTLNKGGKRVFLIL